MIKNGKNILTSRFDDKLLRHKRHLYWLIPIVLLISYIIVIGSFFWIQDFYNSTSYLYFADPSLQEPQIQGTLNRLLIAISCIIIFSLLGMWQLTRNHTRAERSLKAETLFRRAVEASMSTGIRITDMQGSILYVNPAFCRITGWNEVDLLGKTEPYPYWDKDKLEEHQAKLTLLLEGKIGNTGLEMEAIRRDGSRLTARLFASPLRDPKGNQIAWITSLTDITEPKRTRLALASAHERLTKVLESLEDAIVVIGAHQSSQVLFSNRTYKRLFSEGEELLSTVLAHRGSKHFQTHIASIDRHFEVSIQPLEWTDRTPALIVVARDITEQWLHEQEKQKHLEHIQLTSRLTTMGEMASSLAHELNQPMTAISNYNMAAVALLEQEEPNPTLLTNILQKTAQQAERAGRIISRIRAFVKRSEPFKEPVSVQSIVENTLELAQIDARAYGLGIDLHLPEKLPLVLADHVMIEQVLLNLIKNGLEAMPKHTGEAILIEIHEEKELVKFTVSDKGCGIKEPDRLFEPFFSTKKTGLGMGLNICRTIIESHHGNLWASNRPDGGASFFFTLKKAPSPES